MNVTWKEGSPYANRDADGKKAAELGRLIEKHGGTLSSEELLKAARSARNPLHHEFDWDDESAAHQHRMYQARKLLQNVTLVRRGHEVPRFHSVHVVRGGGPRPEYERRYVDVEAVEADPFLRAQAVARGMGVLGAFEARFGNFAEFERVIKAIQDLRAAGVGSAEE